VAVVTLYTKPECHLCEQAHEVLRRVRAELPFDLDVRDITADEALHRAFFERIPVVAVDGEELFEYFVDAETLRERLREPSGDDGARGADAAVPPVLKLESER
jgi:glutaredoxin